MASKNAARLARRNQMVQYNRARPNVKNWVVGGSATDNTGAVIGGATPTGPSTWSCGSGSTTLTSGTPLTYQAVAIVAAPNTSTPTLGRIRIDAVEGTITLANGALGRMAAGVGIYVSEFNSSTGKWDVRDPLATSDASRDDYFFLEVIEESLPLQTAVTTITSVTFKLSLNQALTIGGGQALHVTVSYFNAGGSTIIMGSQFRTRIGPVA